MERTYLDSKILSFAIIKCPLLLLSVKKIRRLLEKMY